jgi:AcrR family transcriptional regulator
MADTRPARDRGAATIKTIGRPRHHDDAEERRLLVDAGFSVMRRNGYAAASLADVLRVAQVSSRAFYRHFASKDELLLAMCRRDAASIARRLRRRVAAAPDPLAAIDEWLEEILATYYNPRRAGRIRVLTSEGARRAAGYDAVQREIREQLAMPLADALAAGHAAGLVRSTDPGLDARTIYRIASHVWEELDHRAALDHVHRYCWPALGLAWPTALTASSSARSPGED